MFKSDRFDYKSDLPEEYNAGNRFYGRDLPGIFSTRSYLRAAPGLVDIACC